MHITFSSSTDHVQHLLIQGTATQHPPSPICAGTPVQLNLSGNTFGTGQTYVWQSSSTSGGAILI